VLGVELVSILKGTIVYGGQTVTVQDPGIDRITVDKANVSYLGKTVGLVDREVIPVLKAAATYSGQTVTIVDLAATDVVPVGKADVLFAGQTVVITDTGEIPVQPGGGGVSIPPWLDFGRKKRRRYRALEEIEKRLDERIERLETESKEKQQEVAAVLALPKLEQENFEQLLRQQAQVTQMLLEAQRRAEKVRQERIQLAILAQRAAEAIDDEEAITMLLLT
jgi:hypothetical protein